GFFVFHGRGDAPAFSQASAKGAVPTSVAADGSAVPAGVDPASSLITGTDAGSPGAGGETGGGAATPQAPAPKAPTAPAGPAPTIISFHGTEDGTIDCHNGNQQNFSAAWTTTNAAKTAIAIDGAPFKTYGANADTSLPFNCAKAHSYTLTATGTNGKTATKTLTFAPRNVQPPQTNDDDPPASNGPVITFPQGAKPQH